MSSRACATRALVDRVRSHGRILTGSAAAVWDHRRDGPESGGDQLDAGRQALEDARWADARAAFEAELARGGSAEALDGLGQALWFLGDVDEGIAARERAFEEYARGGRCDEAARVAVWVSHQYLISGRASAARGWLARAERALEGAGACAGHGWVAVERARHAASVEEQRRARAAGDGHRARTRRPATSRSSRSACSAEPR